MCVGLIGGMDRLERHYIKETERFGIELKVFNKWEANLSKKINHLDALIIFTDKVSHGAKRETMNVAKSRGIPIMMYHSSGICTLRSCLDFFKNRKKRDE